MNKKIICKLTAAAFAAIFAFSQTAFAISFSTKSPALDNTDFAKKSAEIVYLYSDNARGNQPDSANAPLRILGRTNNINYDFKSLGAEESVLCKDGRFLLQFKDNRSLNKCLETLENDSCIVYAHRDAVLYMQAEKSENGGYVSWGAESLKMNEYSEFIQSKNPQNRVTVAVVDSGVARLDFLSGRVVDGYDFVQNDIDPSNDVSSNSHGTFLSSVIADTTRDLNVDILNVRIVEDRNAYLVNAVNGIYYATDKGAQIINFSLCGPLAKAECIALEEAIEYAISNGVTFVTCADNKSADTVNHCPAHVENAVTASAINKNLMFASGMSNYGYEVDVCAPGVNVSGYKADGTIQTLSGTSVSAAYVSACAAMIKLQHPGLNPEQVQQALKKSCMDLGAEGFDIYYGYGLPQMNYFVTDTNIYVENISFDKASITLDIGEKEKITYQISPSDATDKTVEWVSSNTAVAQVDELGNVTAIAHGSAQIKAITSDGKREAVAEITVNEPSSEPYIIGINIKREPDKKNYTYKIDSELDLSGIELEYVYSDNNTEPIADIVNINSDGFNSASEGEQSIKISYNGYEDEFKIKVSYAWWQWIIRILLLGFIWY